MCIPSASNEQRAVSNGCFQSRCSRGSGVYTGIAGPGRGAGGGPSPEGDTIGACGGWPIVDVRTGGGSVVTGAAAAGSAGAVVACGSRIGAGGRVGTGGSAGAGVPLSAGCG